jgi:hypothetical protein
MSTDCSYLWPQAFADTTLRDDDEEDETAELMRELEKIKRERAEQRAREVGPFSFHCQSLPHANTHFRRRNRQRENKSSERVISLKATLF